MKTTAPALTPIRRRLGIAEAKSKLSALLRAAEEGPTVVHNRGRDVAVVLTIHEYERLASKQRVPAGGAGFLDRIDALKEQFDGGVKDFEPARLDLTAQNPFSPRS